MARLHRVNFILLTLVFLLLDNPASANGWTEIKELGKGQTVYWNAWGGGVEINQYIRWVGQEVNRKYDVELKHVKLSDTSEAVNRVLAEKIAGRDQDGSVDLIWINGENFAKMKENQLLYGPFTETLPNFSLVDFENKPTTLVDFTILVDGLEAPWGMAQFNFPYNAERIQSPPTSVAELMAWSKKILDASAIQHLLIFLDQLSFSRSCLKRLKIHNHFKALSRWTNSKKPVNRSGTIWNSFILISGGKEKLFLQVGPPYDSYLTMAK